MPSSSLLQGIQVAPNHCSYLQIVSFLQYSMLVKKIGSKILRSQELQ